MYIVVVYRPLSYSHEESRSLIKYLSEVCAGREVLLVGDFNLPSIAWHPSEPAHQVSSADRLFPELFISLGLTQWASEPTFPRSSSMLDLELTTETDRMGTVVAAPPPPGCDHCFYMIICLALRLPL